MSKTLSERLRDVRWLSTAHGLDEVVKLAEEAADHIDQCEKNINRKETSPSTQMLYEVLHSLVMRLQADKSIRVNIDDLRNRLEGRSIP